MTEKMSLLVMYLTHEHEDLHLACGHLYKAQLGIPRILGPKRERNQKVLSPFLLHSILAPVLVGDGVLKVRWRTI